MPRNPNLVPVRLKGETVYVGRTFAEAEGLSIIGESTTAAKKTTAKSAASKSTAASKSAPTEEKKA